MAYTTIDNPELYFQVKTYTGNGTAIGSGGQAITFDNTDTSMQPNFVWIKERDNSANHQLYDATRGATYRIYPDHNTYQDQQTEGVTSFNSNGFTVGSDGSTNGNTDEYVAWCLSGGTTAIPSGSTSDPGAVNFSATSGFGIYKITAPASADYVLKHGLGTTPDFIWVKDIDATQKHMIFSDRFSNLTNDYFQLNSNAAKATYSTCWGTMNTTDATIATGGTLGANNDHVIYVFSNRQGFLKHGKYVGNANDNGPFIWTGFRPAWVMVKGDRADNWQIMDNKRNGYNVISPRLEASTNASEYTNIDNCDFLSNGFKIRDADSHMNYAEDYYYLAFAEAPFCNSSGIPVNAR